MKLLFCVCVCVCVCVRARARACVRACFIFPVAQVRLDNNTIDKIEWLGLGHSGEYWHISNLCGGEKSSIYSYTILEMSR